MHLRESISGKTAVSPPRIHGLQGFRCTPGNRVELLVDGAEAYPAMLNAICNAEESVVLDSYIFATDTTGALFRSYLIHAAERGVWVRVLLDAFGSASSREEFFTPLVKAGGQVAFFNPTKLFRLTGMVKRDHRKILVVDDVVGFVGGLNIGDDYAPPEWGGSGWHDIHVEVKGPAARELTKVVNRTWRKITKSDASGRLTPVAAHGNTSVQILESRLTQRYSIRRSYLQAIRRARHTVRICNAYCIPDLGIRRALANAVRRGVRVQLLLAGKTDVWMVKYAARALYAGLLRKGIEIYEWGERVLHAKAAVIDKEWCSIGSYNMDRRSLVHNLEANLVTVDPALGGDLDALFERDLQRSERIEFESWHRRPALDKLLEKLFYSIRYLL